MKKILIVDDNKIFMEAFKFILKYEFGIENIDTCNSGKEAIEKINNNQYSTIFMDVNLPDINGIDIAKDCCKKFRKLNIIAISINDDEETIKKMILAGCKSYITKDKICKSNIERFL
jgi:DNA-binding NarL/FixJ family response regulator